MPCVFNFLRFHPALHDGCSLAMGCQAWVRETDSILPNSPMATQYPWGLWKSPWLWSSRHGQQMGKVCVGCDLICMEYTSYHWVPRASSVPLPGRLVCCALGPHAAWADFRVIPLLCAPEPLIDPQHLFVEWMHYLFLQNCAQCTWLSKALEIG